MIQSDVSQLAVDPVATDALANILERLHSVSDAYEFETLWSDGLRKAADCSERDHVLEAAGRQLDNFNTEERSRLGRAWLRHIVDEIRSRGSEPVSRGLAALASKAIRGAFAEAGADFAELREAQTAGLDERSFVLESPRVAASIRGLGRLARGFRGTGLLALADRSFVEQAVAFTGALTVPDVRVIPTVGQWLRVGREDLLQWASSGGGNELPRLIRRLVAETTPSATRIHFPGGTGVALGGWDGLVECEAPSRFVPGGISGWELSVDRSSARKAEDDYDKRLLDVPPKERSGMAYVAVICRPWIKSRQFAQAKSELGEFRRVRALNVDDIEFWLEHAPATTIWLREILNKPVHGVITIADWWKRWLASTTVPLDADIVLAGRERQVEKLRKVCGSSDITTIGGDVRRDEILAFIAASLYRREFSESVGGIEALYVDDPAVARRLLESPSELIVAVPSAEVVPVPPAQSSHHLIVPVPGIEQADIVLPPVDSKVVADRLEVLDESLGIARDLGALARRSLVALRRHYATNPALYRPDWAAGEVGATLRRSLLLNRWNQAWVGDREVVERLLGQSYMTVVEKLKRLAVSADDPPLAIIDEQWHLVSPADAWLLIGNHLTRDDLKSFRDIAIAVLTDPDPLASMPADKRLGASLDGVKAKYSPQLGQGISSTLALLGTLDLRVHGTSTSGANFAESMVQELVTLANDDPSFTTWAALAPSLPLLAEAAPDALLAGFRRGLSANLPLLGAMFRGGESDSFGFPRPSPHNHFLWALEVLAWSSNHLGAVVAILGNLEELDPRGRPNRPSASLKSIMCPWRPNTPASAELRLDSIHHLRRQSGPVAWELMVSMLPNTHSSQRIHPGPRYRGWKEGEPVVTRGELLRITRSIASALIEDAGSDGARWATLISQAGNLPPDARQELIQALGCLDEVLTDDTIRTEIWSAMRALVALHREYSDARWALPGSEISRLDPLITRFSPQSLTARYGWLFDSGLVYLGEVSRRDNLDSYDLALATKRAEAVQDILDTGGWDTLSKFASAINNPMSLGEALAKAAHDQFEEAALETLPRAHTPVFYMSLAYLAQRFEQHGWCWLDQLFDTNDLPPWLAADLLAMTRDPIHAWTRADELGDEVATEYWKRFSIYGLGHESEQFADAAHRLQAVGRFDSALALLAFYAPQHRSDLAFAETVTAALESAMGQDLGERPEADHNAFETLLQVLDRHVDNLGIKRVASIQWYYLPVLGPDPDVKTLHKALAEDPDFFVAIVTVLYRPATAPADGYPEPSELEQAIASNAFQLLNSWNRSPGLDAESRVDKELLRDWICRARRGLADADRLDVGDDAIGEALASSPAEPDGAWPSQPIRDLLEELQSDTIDSGIERGIYNSRGVVQRSLDAGGVQEWLLVEKYTDLKERFSARWLRTAAILSNLARHYEAEARQEDQAAERRRRGLDH